MITNKSCLERNSNRFHFQYGKLGKNGPDATCDEVNRVKPTSKDDSKYITSGKK